MTMNYRSPTKRNYYRNTVIVLGVLFLVFVLFNSLRSVWAGVFFEMTGLQALWRNKVTVVLSDKEDLLFENRELRRLVQEQETTVVMAEYNQRSYQELVREFSEDGGTLAQVLLRPPYSPYDYLVLDQGTVHGVLENQLVIADGQYVIGYINQVSERYSQAILFSSPQEDFLVSIDGVVYPANGDGGGAISLRLPRNFRDSNRLVVTIPGTLPYVLGFAEETAFEPQDSYVRGIMNLPVNLFEREQVWIATDVHSPQEEINSQFNEATE